MRVALIDHVAGGHHAPYARDIAVQLRRAGHEALAVGPEAWCAALADVARPLHVPLERAPPSDRFLERQALMGRFFGRALAEARSAGADAAHVLYLDGTIEALLRAPVPPGLRVCATLHWYPFLYLPPTAPRHVVRGLHALLALRRLDRAGIHLVVHAEVAKRRLDRLGLRKVRVVDYPTAVPRVGIDHALREACRARLGVAPTDRLLLCFGGTRHDKGVDLAIAALAALDANVKLLIAGAEQDFDRHALHQLAAAHGVEGQLVLQLGHVADADVFALFCAADLALLPYRPLFSGQSGPLVIAGSLGVPVVAADVPVLADTVNRFKLGSTFRAGSVAALARALREPLPAVDPARHAHFAAASDPERFAASYAAIYGAVSDVVQRDG